MTLSMSSRSRMFQGKCSAAKAMASPQDSMAPSQATSPSLARIALMSCEKGESWKGLPLSLACP